MEREKRELTICIGTIKKETNRMLQLREKKKEKAVKTKDIRVGKREREIKMVEERKKRKETLTAMDMNGRSTYIEGEIEVLEKEEGEERRRRRGKRRKRGRERGREGGRKRMKK